MKIATLGPEGTFSQEAAKKYNKAAEISFERSIKDVFKAVNEGRAQKGIVPVENSVGGAVGFTLDAFLDYSLKIEEEMVIPVAHSLMAGRETHLSDIKILYLHGQTFSQCENFIGKNLSSAKVLEVFSNAEAARMVSKSPRSSACLGPSAAAGVYGLMVLRENVQDSQLNVTRFFVVSDFETKGTGHDKTSLILYPSLDRPGLLWQILGIFEAFDINLTKIESRPSKGQLGDYVFFADIEGHLADKKVALALKETRRLLPVKILGSYARKY